MQVSAEADGDGESLYPNILAPAEAKIREWKYYTCQDMHMIASVCGYLIFFTDWKYWLSYSFHFYLLH